MSFNDFDFHPHIRAGITSAGYTSPTPIQLQTIPAILEGRDVMGLAQTGTGKTAAFVLPMLQRLMKNPGRQLRALVISPTRELAEQTHQAITALGRQTGLRSVTLYGGVSPQPQVRALRNGVEIAVACPGRLLDLMGQRAASLSRIEMVVLDEADQMFDMGFLPDIRRIMASLPSNRQTMLFSATMPSAVRGLANEMLTNPVDVEISPSVPVGTVSHAVYPVDNLKKTDLLMALLKEVSSGQALVFTRTKHRAQRIADQLEKSGFAATSLQGNLSQGRRQQAMDRFRSGKIKVLVATDIAARGIDVSRISHVINFDMPDTADAYTHRIGRTGRMTNLGTACTFVTIEDLPMLYTIERLLGRRIDQHSLEGFEDSGDRVRQADKTASRVAFKPGRPNAGKSLRWRGYTSSRNGR